MEKQANGDLRPQYVVAAVANVLSFIYGMTLGWTSPMQPLINPNIDPLENATDVGQLSFSLNNEEMSWVAGILAVGGVTGTPLFGFLSNAIGRRKTIMITAGTFLLAFTLTASAKSAIYLLLARFVGGMAGAGTCIIVPMYIGETAEDKIRGILGSMCNLFICAGILASYVIGSYLGSDDISKYFFLSGSMITVCVIFLLATIWLPETPVYCLMRDRPDDAFDSLVRLRGNHGELIERQVKALSSAVSEMQTGKAGSMSILDMLRDTATRKGLIIAITTLIVQQASGISPITTYTVFIFNASGNTDISGAMAAMIVGTLQIIGALLGSALMDRAGRKVLLLASSLGMAATLVPLAYFFHLLKIDTDPETLQKIGWLPVTSLSMYVILFALGYGCVPFVLISELFKTEARSTATSMAIFMVWISAFIFLKFFGNLSDALGLDWCFAIFSLACIGGATFTHFYIVETKGKPLDYIIWELEGCPTAPVTRFSSIPLQDNSDVENKIVIQ